MRRVFTCRGRSGVTEGYRRWSAVVTSGCRGRPGDGARLQGPRVAVPVPGSWGEIDPSAGGGPAMELAVSVTVTQIGEDGTACPVGGELAAALAAPVEQFASMLTWAAQEAGAVDHGDRETVIAGSGRELQRRLLESTFTIDAGCEERAAQVTSAAGIRHGTVEKGHDRGVVSIFGAVRATRLAYRNRREANLYPADARWMLPDDTHSLGVRALVAYHLAAGGYGQAQDVIEARTGVRIGHAQLAGIAGPHRGADRPRPAGRDSRRPGRLGR